VSTTQVFIMLDIALLLKGKLPVYILLALFSQLLVRVFIRNLQYSTVQLIGALLKV
jgi:hypothetical protein